MKNITNLSSAELTQRVVKVKIGITRISSFINNYQVGRKLFEHYAVGGVVRYLLKDSSNVNAMKQTCNHCSCICVWFRLKLSRLGKNFSIQHFEIFFFLIFPENRLDILCKLSPKEMNWDSVSCHFVTDSNMWAIKKTRLYHFDPLKPHFYIVKLGFTGVHIIVFLFLLKNIDCGYSLELPQQGSSDEYPQSMFWAEIWKISEFLSENFHFFGGKIFSIFE